MSSSRELLFLATNRIHDGVTMAGQGGVMRGQRVLKPIGPVQKNAEIKRLRQELAALNARIEELEKQHPEASKIEALRVNALVLARQIDEIRCSSTNDLADLLAR